MRFEPGHVDADLHGRAVIFDRARDADDRRGADLARRRPAATFDAIGADGDEGGLAARPGDRRRQ